jgi:translation elongation factor EF-4
MYSSIHKYIHLYLYIHIGDKIRFMNSGVEYDILEVGVMTPVQVKVDVLRYIFLPVYMSVTMHVYLVK